MVAELTGLYTCHVYNSVGDITTDPAMVQLEDLPPQIQSQSQSTEAGLGHLVELQVTVIGNPPPSLQWQLNGADLPGETRPILRVQNMSRELAGTYACRASNRAGSQVGCVYVVIGVVECVLCCAVLCCAVLCCAVSLCSDRCVLTAGAPHVVCS